MIRRGLGKPACRRLGKHGFEVFVAQPRGRAVIQIVRVVEAVVGAEGVGFAVDAEGDGTRGRSLDSSERLRAVAGRENIEHLFRAPVAYAFAVAEPTRTVAIEVDPAVAVIDTDMLYASRVKELLNPAQTGVQREKECEQRPPQRQRA